MISAGAAFEADASPLELLPRDLTAYRKGNVGIDYVHRFNSGKPGPHVLINALTHGNEICGMVAATHLLDSGVRPLLGTLTVSFANVAAYEAFDPARPYDNRQLVHNLNRIWTPELLDGTERSPELDRARELRPVLDAADAVLDIHSTRSPVQPFWVYPAFGRNAALAQAVGSPAVHLAMPVEDAPGVGVTGWGRHGVSGGSLGAVVVECGQHFAQASADLAKDVTLRFLAHFKLIEPITSAAAAAPRKFVLRAVHMVRTAQFRFVRPLSGFEVFRKGELIAMDEGLEIRAPWDNCTVFMPARAAIVGREAVYLTTPMKQTDLLRECG